MPTQDWDEFVEEMLDNMTTEERAEYDAWYEHFARQIREENDDEGEGVTV